VEHAGGPPLCVIAGFEYPTGHRELVRGEWLCLATDGVTEAMNPRSELYGAARLKALLAANRTEAPEVIIAAVIEDVQRFAGTAEQSDDVTLLCVRWNGPTGSSLEARDSDLLDEAIGT
jgi:serine phosphatase RsbU (regulator of sigma subunit)